MDGCFDVTPTPTGHKLRELLQVMAHINDKILHFFFLAAPDFVLGPDSDYSVRNVIGVVKAAPELATQVVKMRQLGQMMLDRFAGKAIHPIAAVTGGFSKPMREAERVELLKDTQTLLDFSLFALDLPRTTCSASTSMSSASWALSRPGSWAPLIVPMDRFGSMTVSSA